MCHGALLPCLGLTECQDAMITAHCNCTVGLLLQRLYPQNAAVAAAAVADPSSAAGDGAAAAAAGILVQTDGANSCHSEWL